MIYIQGTFSRFAKSTISACEIGHFGGWNAPYCTLKWAISHYEMGNIGMQYGLFRTMIWGISEGNMGRNSLYKACFNSHLHLFRENILSKFSQEKS